MLDDETRADLHGIEPPRLPDSERLGAMWFELGQARVLMDGSIVPVEWQEIAAFANATGYDISRVEALALMDMTRAYSAGFADKNPLSIPPVERSDYG